MAFWESKSLQGTGVLEPNGTNLHVSRFMNGIMYWIWRGNMSDGQNRREPVPGPGYFTFSLT